MTKNGEQLKVLLDKFDSAALNTDSVQVLDLSMQILAEWKDAISPDTLENILIIRSFHLAVIGNIKEALNILVSLSEHGRFKLDIYYLLSFLSNQAGKFDECIYYGEKYTEEFKISPDSPTITDARAKAPEVYNNIATACIKLKKFDNAVQFLEEGLAIKNDFALLYQNLAVIYSYTDRFDKAIDTFERALKACPSDHELYRMYGVSVKERNYFKKSEILLRKALELGSVEALLDAGILYMTLTKWKKAEELLKEYIERTGGNADAVKLLNDLKKTSYYNKKEPTITAALIVKNEEEMLSQCLASVQDVVDEIVVVDTGSTDNTVKIAREYGAKVFHHPWNDSFAEARNHSLRHSSSDWILVIDADEELERQDLPKLLQIKWNEDYDAILFPIFSLLPGQIGGVNQGKHYSPRLFKNREDIYYEGIVHNILVLPENASMAEIKMHHYGYDLRPDKMQEKFKRSLALLKKQIEQNPDDAFARFNIAQMYLSRNYFKEAEEHALHVLDTVSPDNKTQQHIYLMALNQLVLIYESFKDYDSAEKYALQALQTKDDYIDPLITLAWIYFRHNEYEKAKESADRFLTAVEKFRESVTADFLILSKLGSDYEAYFVLGEIERKTGNFNSARVFYEKALRVNPFYWYAYKSLGEIALQNKNYTEAVALFEESLKLGYVNSEKYGKAGTSLAEYKKTVAKFIEAIEKQVQADKNAEGLKDSLTAIDNLLKK